MINYAFVKDLNRMTRYKTFFLLPALCWLLFPLLLSAGPAYPGTLTFRQPDGTAFQARVRGDEHLSVITDLEGRALIRNGDGFWCYAYFNTDGTKVSSGYPVGRSDVPAYVLSASRVIPSAALSLQTRARRENVEKAILQNRTMLRQIRQNAGESAEPVNKHCIVILAQFPDVEMAHTRENFVDMLTRPGYDYNGAVGSAMDYFNDMFRGDFHFEFTVSPIVTLDNKIAYYFGNGTDGQDKNPAQAVAEACRKAHDEFGIDFSLFDDDNDGRVDNVFLFVAGKDEAAHPDEEHWIWSHSWSLRSAGITCELDGKLVDIYAATAEIGRHLRTGKDMFATIGTFCHEYSHTFGLLDMYDTDYEGSGGLSDGLFGSLSLMDSGNYNANGNRPPHYTAVEYDCLGLGESVPLRPGDHVLEPISDNRRFFKYETDNDGEFFLFECRDNTTGWDKEIGGKGLLVYHIDRSGNAAGRSDSSRLPLTAAERWSLAVNQVNANPEHPCARFITAVPGIRAFTADGSSAGNQSRVFFPQKGNSPQSLTPLTDPPFRNWAGQEAALSILNIAFSDTDIRFTVLANDEGQIPKVAVHSEKTFQDGAILLWTASDPDFTGSAVVEWKASDAEETNTERIEPYAPGEYALILSGLSPRTSYEADIRLERDRIPGESTTIKFLTRSFPDNGIAYIFLPEANSDGSFPAGTEIPLHVNNARDVLYVNWSFNGNPIRTGGNGCYKLTGSGSLKAEITRNDGSQDFIIKEIIVK